MSKIGKTEELIKEKAGHFLSGKPIWFWWAGYIVLTAVLFAIFYLVLYVLSVQWWVVVLSVVIIGFVWGTIAFTNKKAV